MTDTKNYTDVMTAESRQNLSQTADITSAVKLAERSRLNINLKGGTLMTIEQLKKYRDICSEIDEIRQELNGKHYAADTVSVCTPPSYTAHSKRIEGYLPDGNTLSLLVRLSDLRVQQRACEEYIDSIKDWQTRRMFELRFYKGKTYLQIAMSLSKGKMTKDCVKKRIYRYVENN